MDRLQGANDVSFRVSFSGHGGHLRLEPLPPVQGHNDLLTSIPDFIIPPAFEPETPDTLKGYLKERYLSPELDPDEFSAGSSGRQWDFDWFDRAKVHLDPSLPTSVVVPSWELPFRRKQEGLHVDSLEMDVSKLMDVAKGSGSLSRIPGPARDFVKGGTNSHPFRPGGLGDNCSSERVISEDARSGLWVKEILKGGLAQTIPPSCKKGMELGPLKEFPYQWSCLKNAHNYLGQSSLEDNVSRLSMQFDVFFSNVWEDSTEETVVDRSVIADTKTELKLDMVTNDPQGEDSVVDGFLVPEFDLPDPNQLEGRKENMIWLAEGTEEIASNFHVLVPDLALNFPFELDKFQKEAIYYIERGESVFVAAHTSAGKTVVAEYAFALTSKHCTRAVYTAPIKTISNQKYRDFCEKFDVGLLTGDVSLRPEASCLIMTTEILRSMLYRGADIIRDIEWVIFDEVHYVNDVERGVVWEEVIIMLPQHVNIILLSATVPNTREFADWIGRTKEKKIRVTGTLKRPVPLEHCLFYCGEFYKICENEHFLPQGLRVAKDVCKKKSSNMNRNTDTSSLGKSTGSLSMLSGHSGQSDKFRRDKEKKLSTAAVGSNNRGSWRSDSSLWRLLINRLANKSLLPVVIFCFSKNRCDKSADYITGIDLTRSSEKNEITSFCKKAFTRLKGSDRNLPQVIRVENLLRRGIGVHHAGLLPIVKEVVEILFCRGFVKVLFSTETFAMGVNAPARTVVFDTLRKFDGKEFRSLLPGEYIQMAGRAGRRGLDKIGTVIVMCRDEIPEEHDLKHVIVGTPTRLESQFRLTYTMILHLLRLEELKVEDMLKRSFAEFHAQKKLPEKEQLLFFKLSQPTKSIECIKGEPAIEEYLELVSQAEIFGQHISEALMQSSTAPRFLTPGRVIMVRSKLVEEYLLGVVIKATSGQYIVLLLIRDATPLDAASAAGLGKLQLIDSNLSGGHFIPPKGSRDQEDYIYSFGARKASGAINIKLPYSGCAAGKKYEVISIEGKDIMSICKRMIKIDHFGLLEKPHSAVYTRTVQQLLERKSEESDYLAVLDPLKDLKLNDVELVDKYHHYNRLLQKMTENKCHGCIKLKEHLMLMKEIIKHREEVNALKYQMSDEALQQMPDFQGRIDVLKEIGCIDSDLVVQIKGRVACEMNSGEELICTECLFENHLEDLQPEEAVALMSALVFQQKNTSEPKLSSKLSNAKKRLYDTAIRLGQLQADFGLTVVPEDYVRDNLKFGLVEVVYEWAKGTPFADICELTDVPEGLIVRTIMRLDETCREFRNAASIMGNSALYKKMEAASNAIKRDIVFAASLYVTGV